MADELPHGYDLGRLAAMARWVATRTRVAVIDWDEALAVASAALIERLYAPGPPPSPGELFRAANTAVQAAADAIRRERGETTNKPGVPAPGWHRYWHGAHLLQAPWEDDLLDRLAVGQVIAALPARDTEILTAYADADGDRVAAAASLGMTYNAFSLALTKARSHAREYWYAPDPAAPQWARDRKRKPGARPRRYIGHLESGRRARKDSA